MRVIGPRGYSAEQVEAWLSRAPTPCDLIDRAASGARLTLACNEADEPQAYALLAANSHLDHIYCHPDHARKGLALFLLAQAEEQARAAGTRRIYSEASELARGCFERSGYRVLQRRDFTIAGVAMHHYAMEKILA